MGFRVIETFSGIGSQVRALEATGLFNVELVGTSEIDKDAILSYAAIHCNLTSEFVEYYSGYPTMQEMADELTRLNIGYDFVAGRAYNWSRLVNSKTDELKKYWLANKLSRNLGDISLIQELPVADLLTFSFPCTDISVAGVGRGLNKGETRSGLVWEVIRLLQVAKDKGTLPKYLLMENVKNLVGIKFKAQFDDLNSILNDIGYNVYWKVINAEDCGIPQSRERVFGIYIRKDIDSKMFTFPKPLPRLFVAQDFLEATEEKHKLPQRKLDNFYNNTGGLLDLTKKRLGTSHADNRMDHCMRDIIYNVGMSVPTLTATAYKGSSFFLRLPLCLLDTKELRDMGSLKTLYTDLDIAVNTVGSGIRSNILVHKFKKEDLVIYKLTPKESMKLMGFSNIDFNKCVEIGLSDTMLYKQTGNSIVTACLYLLFEHLYKAQYDTSYECIDDRVSNEGIAERLTLDRFEKVNDGEDISYLLNVI